MKWLEWFFRSNDTWARLLRTIIQGILGVLVANVDLLFTAWAIDPTYKPMLVALVMCVLSPIMKELGGKDEYPNDFTESA